MPSKGKRKKAQSQKVVRLESLKQINLNAAGLDIGSAAIWACVPEDRDDQPVRQFATFTVDLKALADWLETCGIESVAMESSGNDPRTNPISIYAAICTRYAELTSRVLMVWKH